MKAVIVDKEGKYAVALTKNGEFIKLKNKDDFKVGYEIDLVSGPSFNSAMLTRITAVAASVLFFIGIGCGIYSYAMPYSYINIDINPSIEITSNIYDRIIDMKGLNKDGEKILSSVSVRNKGVEAAIGNILQSAVKNGYLGVDSQNAVMFTVSGKSERKVEEIEDKVENTAKKQLDASSVKTEIIVEKVTLQSYEKAEDMGVSPGKALLIEKLRESNPEADIESYKDAPVKEIMKKISGNKKADNAKIKEESGKQYEKTGKDKNGRNKENKYNKQEKENIKYKDKSDENSVEESEKDKEKNKDRKKDKDKEKNYNINGNNKQGNNQKYKSNNQEEPDGQRMWDNGKEDNNKAPKAKENSNVKEKDNN